MSTYIERRTRVGSPSEYLRRQEGQRAYMYITNIYTYIQIYIMMTTVIIYIFRSKIIVTVLVHIPQLLFMVEPGL